MISILKAIIKSTSRESVSPLRLLLFFGLTLSACQEPSSIAEEDSFSFGLPGKGDQSCDIESPLCWSGADADHARTLMDQEAEILLGDRPPRDLVTAIERLDHKLTPKEREALQSFKDSLTLLGQSDDELEVRSETIKAVYEQVYGRVISGYWGAHATLLSEAVESETVSTRDSKADGVSGQIPDALPTTQKIKPALDTLWAQGPFGQYLVTMLTLTGTHDYEPSARSIIDREAGVDVAVDIEAEHIVNHYSRLAAVDSFFAGMASLIPIAGAYLSIPYGIYAQFKIRARMSIELGALYGLDPTDPDDYLVIVQGMVTAQGFKELFSTFYKSLIGAQGYRMIAGRGGNQFLVGEDQFSERRVDELTKLSLAQFAIYGIRAFEIIKARVLGSTTRSLMGSVTFGVTTLAEVTIDYLTLRSLGRELRYMLHPWGWAAYLESMPLLADEGYRSCAHSALIEMARADNDVNELEAMFLQEMMLKPFHSERAPVGAEVIREISRRRDTAWVAFIDRSQILDQATYASGQEPFRCLTSTWADEDSFTQLSLLSWLRLMAHSDGRVHEDEEWLFNSYSDFFSVKEDEARVFQSMVDRVAEHPHPDTSGSFSLWIWSEEQAENFLEASSDETRIELWRAIR